MESFVQQRKVVKGKLTRVFTFLSSVDRVPQTEVRIRLEKLEEYLKEFFEIQTKIDSLCTDETETAAQEVEKSDFESRYFDAKTQLAQLLDPEMTPMANTSSTPSVTPAVRVKLPRLDLPRFSGNVLQWPSFYHCFDDLIDKNDDLSKIQKLQYLKMSLDGEPARLIQSLETCDDNYSEAWHLLLQRYEDKHLLIRTHLQRLVYLPQVGQERPKDLRRVLDISGESIRALASYGIPTEHWDAIIIFLITERLDNETRREWEIFSRSTTSLPVYSELRDFLEARCRGLLASERKEAKSYIPKPRFNARETRHLGVQSYHSSSSGKWKICLLCQIHACFNCLRVGHSVRQCSAGSCRACGNRHHTLLHEESVSEGKKKSEAVSSNTACGSPSQVLLSTAVVELESGQGHRFRVRALLDSGSQVSFISQKMAHKLALPLHQGRLSVRGIGGFHATHTKGFMFCNLYSLHTDFSLVLKAYVIPVVASEIQTSANIRDINDFHNLELADPEIGNHNEIDIIIGADAYGLLFDHKVVKSSSGPVAHKTALGWVVSGPVINTLGYHCTVSSNSAFTELSHAMKRFCELEETPKKVPLSIEEKLCERHFADTHTRDDSGRYIVRLPFISNAKLGSSRFSAINRFLQVEKRLDRNPQLKRQYVDFMREYIQLGHMELCEADDTANSYYLPHHNVIKEDSTTTKLRVVFDASCVSSNGKSLNNILYVGPKLQDDLISILIRFRTHAVAFTADIEKMYRQIWVHKDDTPWQRVVWRENTTEEIKDYKLLTVTYGTASAPYQAMKCLQQLAEDEGINYPSAAFVAKNDFYVDDVMSGAPSVSQALMIQNELVSLLKRAHFNLRKWTSNSESILAAVDPERRETRIPLHITDEVKSLGLLWNPSLDTFMFSLSKLKCRKISKRGVLSEIAQIFDPLGWLNPTTILAKQLLQKLWQLHIQWDDELPSSLQDEWLQFKNHFLSIEKIQIPRYFPNCDQGGKVELHGFCDASEKAYAAVIYLRHSTELGSQVSLVCSKAKVAPLKKISLPRLELCGAVLLARLMKLVIDSIRIPVDNSYGWTDSTIVLAWINGQPARWRTFVANRVSEIQEIIPPSQWRHVSTSDNPADCASRGIFADELQHHKLWWRGPPWLLQVESWRSIREVVESPSCIEEEKVITLHNVSAPTSLMSIFSSLTRMKRVIAYCLRFVHNCKTNVDKKKGFLSREEIENAMIVVVKMTQAQYFGEEIRQLQNRGQVGKSSVIKLLHPFVDIHGVLRVGGRLTHSSFDNEKRHPIILPKHSKLTSLVIESEHRRLLHSGVQLTLASLNHCYWIIGARGIVRQHIFDCIPCFKLRATASEQLMGELPYSRVNALRPFLHTGVDYAGPVMTKTWRGRNAKNTKSYISLFVCMSTKAIHLELVSDLTTDSFLAAFNRFVSRRGRVTDLYSDCGTNFVGAHNELKRLHTLSYQWSRDARESLANDGVTWHFIPPGSPHFGGLWEAGVKSTKHHLRRVMGNDIYTFEELTTLLTQVEAVLNSRPLCPSSSDPTDYNALTPGHFLIGEPLIAVPEPSLLDIKENRLSKWQSVQQKLQHFWKRWSSEYLTRLQQRPKWTKQSPNLKVGDMVIVKEECLPPLKWKLARVVDVHPGQDSCVRVVSIRTSTGVFKRPVSKLCLLPFEKKEGSSCDVNTNTLLVLS